MIKNINNLFTICLLATATTTMIAMQPSANGILRESTFNNPHRNKNNAKLVAFNRTDSEHTYIKNETYLQSLENSNQEIKTKMPNNARELLIEKYLRQDARQYTAEEIELATAMYTNEQEARNKRRKTKIVDANKLRKPDNEYAYFYDHAATHLFRASLIVGGLYLVSRYFSKKK